MMERRMTPAAQMSTATVWVLHFSSTSGGLKPGVPARAACRCGNARHAEQTVSWPGHVQDTWPVPAS